MKIAQIAPACGEPQLGGTARAREFDVLHFHVDPLALATVYTTVWRPTSALSTPPRAAGTSPSSTESARSGKSADALPGGPARPKAWAAWAPFAPIQAVGAGRLDLRRHDGSMAVNLLRREGEAEGYALKARLKYRKLRRMVEIPSPRFA